MRVKSRKRIDADSISGAVAFYPISDPATDAPNVLDLPVRGGALSSESELFDIGNDSVVRFTVHMPGLTTDTIEIAIDPAELTANGGAT
jgi:hypothetical protein